MLLTIKSLAIEFCQNVYILITVRDESDTSQSEMFRDIQETSSSGNSCFAQKLFLEIGFIHNITYQLASHIEQAYL